MIALVEDSVTEEKLRREPSKELLIINGSSLRILLGFEVSFYFKEPSFVHYSINTDFIAMCQFVESFNGKFGRLIALSDL